MPAIPNTLRRGAVYWFRRSRNLPSGNSFRAMVSLRTACPRAARFRAAILNARFEELCVRLFGNTKPKFTMDSQAAARVFQAEFKRALDEIENEREHARSQAYDFRDFKTFLDVHEEVYRFLAENNCSGDDVTLDEWWDRMPPLDVDAVKLGYGLIARKGPIWYQNLDETYDALEAQQFDSDMVNMDHGMRLRSRRD